MAPSTPFTPLRVFICAAIFFTVTLFIFHDNVLKTVVDLHKESCGHVNTGSSHVGHQTFPYVFTPDPELGSLQPEGDQAWDRLNTKKGGFLWVEYNETLDVAYGISMFHGIHCLQILRHAFQSQLGITSMKGDHGHHSRMERNEGIQHEHGQKDRDLGHLGHCLAYIAEMLLCTGDSTIEHPVTRIDERTGFLINDGIDGRGAQHQCRDIDHLWAVARSTETKAANMWDYRPGDTVESVFFQ
ncbi:uncharacterized protein PV07_09558 [Cladophialophora immunda]|uniref:Uncharacterized protein n=1 Tax=Cladophialophora immunda TaxID=569365 RepID=A0A0D2C7L5_9EURO|nr:uncharacterized protein PV07_09558 [Cladophialophora immunda]KIW26465.1 hypothetical protein PV07_09558 [Cladophialophora immunda]OQV01133.1 hypothetical protein CLAIMM_06540 [Cladophialophora immunda]